MRHFRVLIRIATGLVFVFSGFVKAIDPLGSAYKFHDYFIAFDIDFLKFTGLPLSVLLCTAEFVTGISLVTGLRQREGTWAAFILIAFFTPLTLFLAITNPVSDCGCFGDAVHLTNWQTFGKNVLLLGMIIYLFISRKEITDTLSPVKEWTFIGSAVLLIVAFCSFNIKYLPLIDFLPYKVGVNISEGMSIPDDAPHNQYKTSFIYEKDGTRKEFTLEDYPADDTTWKFVEQVSILIKEGYTPPIHDFSVSTLDNDDITRDILNDNGYTLLMISKKLSETDPDRLEAGFLKGIHCITSDIGFYVITASGSDEIRRFENGLQFCKADETALKTIVRSNPGYVLIKDGTIIGKWSWANLPEDEWFSGDMVAKQLRYTFQKKEYLQTGMIILSAAIISFLVFRIYRKKHL